MFIKEKKRYTDSNLIYSEKILDMGLNLAHMRKDIWMNTFRMATYGSIQFAFAVHGYKESTFNTKDAHHSSFHWRNLQQTCKRGTTL